MSVSVLWIEMKRDLEIGVTYKKNALRKTERFLFNFASQASHLL